MNKLYMMKIHVLSLTIIVDLEFLIQKGFFLNNYNKMFDINLFRSFVLIKTAIITYLSISSTAAAAAATIIPRVFFGNKTIKLNKHHLLNVRLQNYIIV